MDKLEVDTRKGTLSLNGVELDSVTEINIKLHDDDKTTVAVTLSPCDVGRILRTFKIKKNVEVTDNGKDNF